MLIRPHPNMGWLAPSGRPVWQVRNAGHALAGEARRSSGGCGWWRNAGAWYDSRTRWWLRRRDHPPRGLRAWNHRHGLRRGDERDISRPHARRSRRATLRQTDAAVRLARTRPIATGKPVIQKVGHRRCAATTKEHQQADQSALHDPPSHPGTRWIPCLISPVNG